MSEQKKNVSAKVTMRTLKELKKLAVDEEMNVPDLVGKLLDSLIEKKLKKVNEVSNT